MIIGIMLSVVFLALVALSYYLAMAFGALITFLAAVLSLIVYLRTRNPYFIAGIMAHIFATAFLIMIALGTWPAQKYVILLLLVFMLSFQVLLIIFGLQKKMKWRSREVLELAARPVGDIKNGFTGRPMHAGTADYSIEELEAFTRFIQKSLIAIPVREKDRTIFIVNLPWGAMISFSRQYRQRTYLAFDHNGKLSVNISQQDYLLYRDRLAFDQLCQSMGALFTDFMEAFKKGESIAVMERFNALKLNIITEG